MAVEVNKGIIDRPSNHPVEQTVATLEAILRSKGITVFAVVDHSGEAKKVGMAMRPTKLVIFGNPKAGTPLMQAEQAIGIDLPLKMLVWQDASGATWLSYNDPTWLAKRHGLAGGSEAAANAMAVGLDGIARAAGGSP